MTEHHLDAQTGTVTDVFQADLPPVLTMDPGDTLITHSLDASGYVRRQTRPGEKQDTLIPGARGHCLNGPIAVRGAEPGMMLAVHLVALHPDEWGWTAAAARDNELNRRLGVADGPAAWLLWDIDSGAGTARNQLGLTVDLAPFLGVIGTTPAAPGEHSTIPPRVTGGNIDCRELVAGSTLYLPVEVAGALLCLGDGHGAQGDGEVGGTAVECGMTTELTIGLATDPPIGTPHAVTPTGRITFGFSEDLNEASAQALDAMLGWMQTSYSVDRSTALALASPVVNLRVTQVANQVWGVHAVLPNGALR